MRRVARLATALITLAVGTAASGAPVLADAAGPTDYRSEVVAVDPPTATIDAAIVGGDAFVRLVVAPGTVVVVLGYHGEDYLRFDPDGTVYENVASPAHFANASRFGGDVPAGVSPDAAPDWQRVAGGGAYAWHDHRAHRMERFAPVNASRGDQVLDGVVPLRVDGEPVDLRIAGVWMPAPSWWPVLAGLVLGTAVALVAVRARTPGGRRAVPLGLAVLAAAALAVGWSQFRSLPAETDPRVTWWLMPLLALALAGAAAVVRPRLLCTALGAIAGAELALWAWQRRDGLRRAVLPTDLPFWLDRMVSAAALTGGLVVAVSLTVALLRPTAPTR